MAEFVYLDADITVNGVNLSDRFSKATLKIDVEDKESTTFGSGWKRRKGGLKDGTVELEFNQDFAASAIDDTFWPLLGQVVPFTLKPTSAVTSATNPEYAGEVLIKEYSPLDGTVGDLAKNSVTWPTSGQVTRNTA